MKLSKEDISIINWIKDNINTQDKWDKDDYADFYNRDVKSLLNIIDKLMHSLAYKL